MCEPRGTDGSGSCSPMRHGEPSGLAPEGDDVPAEVDHGRRHAFRGEHRDRLVGGVALGDGAEIDRHPGPAQEHGPIRGGDHDVAPPDQRERRGDLGRRGDSRGVGADAPELYERADGQVEPSAAERARSRAPRGSRTERVGGDGDRPGACRGVDLRHLAFGPVGAHAIVDLARCGRRPRSTARSAAPQVVILHRVPSRPIRE